MFEVARKRSEPFQRPCPKVQILEFFIDFPFLRNLSAVAKSIVRNVFISSSTLKQRPRLVNGRQKYDGDPDEDDRLGREDSDRARI